MIDGTFKSCPIPFYQILTYGIHGLKINRKIPLAWAYVEGKTTSHYRKVFRIIKQKIEELSYEKHNWQPAEIVSDYERAIFLAVESEFPQSTHMGCYFHFTQAIYRSIGKLGLTIAYKEDGNFRTFARLIMSTPFLPVFKVQELILYLCDLQFVKDAFRDHPQMADFLKYFHSTWILTFESKIWNCFKRQNGLRTTNSCESWHVQWNRKLSRSRPSFWTSLRMPKKEEVQVKNAICQVEMGYLPPLQKK